MRTLFKLEKKIFSIQKRKFVTIKSGKEEAPGTVRKNSKSPFNSIYWGQVGGTGLWNASLFTDEDRTKKTKKWIMQSSHLFDNECEG